MPRSWWSAFAQTLERDDPASALIVCLLAYARLRTLNESSELQRRDVGRKVLRVNARKTHRMRTVDILPPHETYLRPSIAARWRTSPSAPQ